MSKSVKKQPDLKYAFRLPPEKAIAYFKSKGYAFSWDWQGTWQEAHAKAFTVAKVMRMDILQDIRGMVQKALDEGITFQQFKKELEPKLRAKGWWGKKLLGDIPAGPDGKEGVSSKPRLEGGRTVQLGSPHRLQTIFRANTQSAYMAGREKAMMENVDNRPFFQYVAILDRRTRPGHRILHGKVFRFDDPFWDTHTPPNGWRCRCRKRALSEGNLTKRGLTPESGKGHLKNEMVKINNRGDERRVTVYTDPKTGLTMHPDPGWNYNPGKADWNPDLSKYDPDIRKLYKEKTQPDLPKEQPLFSHIKSKPVKKLCQDAFADSPEQMRDVVRHFEGTCSVRASSVRVSQYNGNARTISLSRRTMAASDLNTLRHEFGHHVDFQAQLSPGELLRDLRKNVSSSEGFRKVFHDEAESIFKNAEKEARIRTAIEGPWRYDPIVSDLLGSLTRNRIVGFYSHDLRYLTHRGKAETEVFANLFAIYGRKDKAAWEFVKKELPSLAETFEAKIAELKNGIG